MWQQLGKYVGGAAEEDSAAPLLVYGVKLRSRYRDCDVCEPGVVAKLDTGTRYTVIPETLAVSMKPPAAGMLRDIKCFDHSCELPAYPKFKVEVFIPHWGWFPLTVVACPRDNILLGRDVCRQMLLVVNWRAGGFGMTPAQWLHHSVKSLFWRRKRNDPDGLFNFPWNRV